ncbi:MAG: hypothetical protein U0350_13765 [Caldilineaceae bacterium]
MTPTIRVLVLTDEAWLHTSLRILLSNAKDVQLVGEAVTVQELPVLCRATRPQIILAGGGKAVRF